MAVKKKDGTGEEQKRNVSDKGKAFIKSYEKLSLTVYDASDSDETDPSKMKDPTIGWGHSLKGNDEELTHYAENGISKEDADALFEKDVKIATDDANAIATTPLTQNEFDAFASLLYSAGRTNVVRGGKTLSALNSGNKRRTARIWRRAFITSFKKELDGLKYRRRDEVELFLHGDYKRDY